MNGWLNERNLRHRLRHTYGFFHDNPATTAPALLRYDACVPIAPGLEADEAAGIARQTLPGGAFAVYTHVGAYEEMGALLSELHRRAVPQRGLKVDYARPFVAVYLNDPTVTRQMHRRTELCVPVLPVRMLGLDNDDHGQHIAAERRSR